MQDELLQYYERELTYLRRLGAEFGKQYPRVAAGLQLEPTKSDDPHVERLLEGFAFLAARVHLKLDSDFPLITEALLDTVYPEYTRPLPSISLVQFHVDPEQGQVTTGYPIPRDTVLHSREISGVACRFRTCYDTTLWPLEVAEAAWVAPHQLQPPVRATEAAAALRVKLLAKGEAGFAKLPLESLRIYLNAEPAVAAALYELLCNNCVEVLLRQPGRASEPPIRLPASALRPVGFEQHEGVLPVPRRSFIGYRLLTEYFAFPEKYFFLDLGGLERLRGSSFGTQLEVVFLISRFERGERRTLLEAAVNADVIRLGCTPVVNLFPRISEPVLLTQRRPEYPVIADARRRDAIEIYAIEDVSAVTTGRADVVRLEPLYAYRHSNAEDQGRLYWQATRRPRDWRATGAWDTYLSFVDLNAVLARPELDAVTARLVCYNADLPKRLPIGDPRGDFELPGGGPVRRIAALVQPTALIRPRVESALLWRLTSLLSLNFVSLVEGGPAALQELLKLHNVRDSAAADKEIQAIVGLTAQPTYARIAGEHGLAFGRGHRVALELDEDQFVGGGVYLFASVIERFLGLYTSLNSFNVLSVATRQRRETVKEWPPRAGWKALV
ncbi:MAG: type VI secretion system baseplate subunit TssF [Gemmatimonadetes bacterium]|nr:type VI secretion system baseplate subunit TssF [Gemmatimonadota bacterium]